MMFRKHKTLTFVLLISLFHAGCIQKQTAPASKRMLIYDLHDALTDALVQDGFSPPVASRVYAYPSIAAYEGSRFADSLPSFSEKLNGFYISTEGEQAEYNYRAVMVSAFCKVAAEMVFHDYIIDSVREHCMSILRSESKEDILKRSNELGLRIASQILSWASKDYYRETRNMPRFNPTRIDGHWEPTPPTFSNALEPYWGKIRPFVLDSSTQFKLSDPPEFGITKDAAIYKAAEDVMQHQANADSLEKLLVEYWDDNPKRTFVKGHVMYAERQISPGGHWMHITKTVCRKKNLSEAESARTLALTSIALFDGFIACWEGKYRTDYIRPETYINKYIDQGWLPQLETPPFPEYPSGHAAISTAAATVLEDLFGKNFAFTDSAEVDFRMWPRDFASFRQAADEAAMSRVNGGIHFIAGCNEGKELGSKVGELIVEKLIKK